MTSGPTTTFLQTSQYQSAVDEAAYVVAKGSPAVEADVFFDTTLKVVKVFKNGAWQIELDDSDTDIARLANTQTFTGNNTLSGIVDITNTTEATDDDTAALVVDGGLAVKKDVIITGDLTVAGTSTSVADLVVTDETITVNNGGSQAVANSGDAGLIVSMSDATNTTLHYDSTATSRFKAGDVGSTKEIVTISDAQVVTLKDIDGGTATNTSRFTLPKDTTTNLDALTDKEATIAYDTTLNSIVYNTGAAWNPLNTLTTNGDILYYNSGLQRLAKGSDSEVLTLSSGIPAWSAAVLGVENDTAVSATYTVLTTDNHVRATTNTFTITLYTAVGNEGRKVTVTNQGTGVISLASNASEEMDGDSATRYLSETQSATLQSDGAGWVLVAYTSLITAVSETVSHGNSGGTATSGAWQTRVLNTVHADVPYSGKFATVSANQLTLEPGTYTAKAHAPAFRCEQHQARLYRPIITDTILWGTSEMAVIGGTQSVSFMDGTLGPRSVATIYEVQHRVNTTRATNGFGVDSTFTGGSQVFTFVEITKHF